MGWRWFFFYFTESPERGQEGGHELRELQDDDDDALEAQPEWGASV